MVTLSGLRAVIPATQVRLVSSVLVRRWTHCNNLVSLLLGQWVREILQSLGIKGGGNAQIGEGRLTLEQRQTLLKSLCQK